MQRRCPCGTVRIAGYIVVGAQLRGVRHLNASYTLTDSDQQSKDMIDALTAHAGAAIRLGDIDQRQWQLFITGYSQGGFVAMATQRPCRRPV